MRNYLKKLNLWQQKRNSLPILDDEQLDWAEMEAILNLEMPQSEDDKRVILLSPPKKLNLLSLMLLSFSAAAMTLVVTHVVKTKHQQNEYHNSHHKKHQSFSNKSDLNKLNDSLINNNDVVMFDSVALKSYLFINSTEAKGEVKLESLADIVALNSTPLPLISYWQQKIEINTQYNLNTPAIANQKNTATIIPSNKVIDNLPLPIFSNDWLNIETQKLTNTPVKPLINTTKMASDSITNAKSNTLKEHYVTTPVSSVLATKNKPDGNLAKNNLSSIASTIKTSTLVIAGASATTVKSNLVENSSTTANHKKGSNLTMNKVNLSNKLKNVPNNKANAIMDTISTSLKTKNSNYDTTNESYTSKTNNTVVKNNKINLAKNLQKNIALVSTSKISNNSINIKAANKANPNIDSVTLMAKAENKPDDSIISIPFIKTSSPIGKNNKNHPTKKSKPTVFSNTPAYNSNRSPVKNLKFASSKAINNPSSQSNNTDNSVADSVIKPNATSYSASENKNRSTNNANKTRKSLNKTKSKTSLVTASNEKDDNQLGVNEPVIISSVTKKVENEIVVPDLMTYGKPTTFYIELTKLNPIGKPTLVNLINNDATAEDITDEDMESENKKLTIFTLLDYGLLFGLNNPDSFYSYNQGSNSNGAPFISPFFGLFANFSLHNKWSISTQVRFMVPRNSSVGYNFFSQISSDTAEQTKVTSTRKIYTADFPIHLVYKLNKSISFFAGPTISLPIMQISVNNQVQIATITGGIATYKPYINYSDYSSFSHIPSLGFSGGGNYQFNRYRLGILWDKSLTGYQINSNYGTSSSFLSSFQLTFGISLKKPKLK